MLEMACSGSVQIGAISVAFQVRLAVFGPLLQMVKLRLTDTHPRPHRESTAELGSDPQFLYITACHKQ